MREHQTHSNRQLCGDATATRNDSRVHARHRDEVTRTFNVLVTSSVFSLHIRMIVSGKNPPLRSVPKQNNSPSKCMSTKYLSPRTKYSRELKARLISAGGGKCVRCGSREHLQFDCVVSTGADHHRFNYRQRLKFYEAEAARNNIQLLCPSCHTAKTLDEIAARRFHEARITCPNCNQTIKVSEQLRKPTPLPVALNFVEVPPQFVCGGLTENETKLEPSENPENRSPYT